MGRRLFVGNLSYDTTEMGLRELFSLEGTVSEAKIVSAITVTEARERR